MVERILKDEAAGSSRKTTGRIRGKWWTLFIFSSFLSVGDSDKHIHVGLGTVILLPVTNKKTNITCPAKKVHD